MGLPARVDYEITDLRPPASRAGWEPRAERCAVLVHDLQRYFVGVFSPESPVWRLAAANTRALLVAARSAGIPVVYSAQPGDQDPRERGLLCELWGPGLGHDGTDIVAEVAPHPGELVLTKHRYSAFARTDLEAWLRTRGRDQLVITGIYAHIGIAATATDAFMRDIQPIVPLDAVADFSREDHERALVQIAGTCGVVATTAQVLAAFGGDRSAGGEADWPAWLIGRLTTLLGDARDARRLVVDEPSQSLFDAGLDSVRALLLFEELAGRGVEVDLVDFAQAPTAAWLLDRIGAIGVARS